MSESCRTKHGTKLILRPRWNAALNKMGVKMAATGVKLFLDAVAQHLPERWDRNDQ